MKAAQPMSITIRQIEFELEKAEHGMALPYDTQRVMSCADPAVLFDPGNREDVAMTVPALATPVLADRRQRLREQRHPSIEDVLQDRGERPLVSVPCRDDDLLLPPLQLNRG